MSGKGSDNSRDLLLKSDRGAGRLSECQEQRLFSKDSVPVRHICLRCQSNNGVPRMPSLLLYPVRRICRKHRRKTELYPDCHK